MRENVMIVETDLMTKKKKKNENAENEVFLP
jgi:hypothetical protein